jgi:hypothetical protein
MTTAPPQSVETIARTLSGIADNHQQHGLFGAELQAVKDAEMIVRNCWDLVENPARANALDLCNEIERRLNHGH